MKILEKEFTNRNVTYRQMKREGDVAIYSYSPSNASNRIRGYETIIITRHNGYIIAGTTITPAETYPGASQFGKKGFAYLKYDLALDKFDKILQSQLIKSTTP